MVNPPYSYSCRSTVVVRKVIAQCPNFMPEWMLPLQFVTICFWWDALVIGWPIKCSLFRDKDFQNALWWSLKSVCRYTFPLPCIMTVQNFNHSLLWAIATISRHLGIYQRRAFVSSISPRPIALSTTPSSLVTEETFDIGQQQGQRCRDRISARR